MLPDSYEAPSDMWSLWCSVNSIQRPGTTLQHWIRRLEADSCPTLDRHRIEGYDVTQWMHWTWSSDQLSMKGLLNYCFPKWRKEDQRPRLRNSCTLQHWEILNFHVLWKGTNNKLYILHFPGRCRLNIFKWLISRAALSSGITMCLWIGDCMFSCRSGPWFSQ
jgi:hypothetical protein